MLAAEPAVAFAGRHEASFERKENLFFVRCARKECSHQFEFAHLARI
jgi:hypothetical protein